jgi:hypothetical protein
MRLVWHLFLSLLIPAALVVSACLAISAWGGEDPKKVPSKTDSNFRIGQTIVVTVPVKVLDGLKATNKDWGCYLNGRFIPDCPPSRPETSPPPAAGAPEAPKAGETPPPPREVRFVLERTPGNREVWRQLLANDIPRRTTLAISVGTADGSLISGELKRIVWEPLSTEGPGSCKTVGLLVVIGLVLFGVILASLRSSWLRDPPPNPAATGAPCRHWSLGRVQLLFWSLNVVIAFLFIWSLAGSTDRLTAFALGVLLVGGATAGGAAAADHFTDLRAGVLRAEAADAATTPGRQAEIKLQLPRVERGVADRPCRFWSDLVTGQDGVSLARFQYVIWTAVLGIAFWGSVLRNLSMPDFDATFLVLMGISGGTYIGMKRAEGQK